MMVRFALKAETREIHAELDRRLSTLKLQDSRDYRRFMRFQARSIPSAEDALLAAGLANLLPCWPSSRRSAEIEADLADLGHPIPAAAVPPAINGTAEVLGMAYVAEGSRLGGRVLSRQLGKEQPARFLKGDGSLGSWPALLNALEQHIDTEDRLAGAKDAAHRAFAWFLDVADEENIG